MGILSRKKSADEGNERYRPTRSYFDLLKEKYPDVVGRAPAERASAKEDEDAAKTAPRRTETVGEPDLRPEKVAEAPQDPASEQVAPQGAEAARLDSEKREAEEALVAKRAADVAALERVEAERARQQAEAEKTESLRAAAQRVELEKAAAERRQAEKAEADRRAAEIAEVDRKVKAEKAEAERRAAEIAEVDRKVKAEKAEADRKLKAEKAEAERKAAEKADAERKAAEKAEVERKAAERAEAERKAAEKAEAERKAKAEKAEAARQLDEKRAAEKRAQDAETAKRRAADKEAAARAAEKARAAAEELRAARARQAAELAALRRQKRSESIKRWRAGAGLLLGSKRARGIGALVALFALSASALWLARTREQRPEPVATATTLEPADAVRREVVLPEALDQAPATKRIDDTSKLPAQQPAPPERKTERPTTIKDKPKRETRASAPIVRPDKAKIDPSVPIKGETPTRPSGDGIKATAPVKMFAPQPTYPAEAQGRGEAGTVVLAGTIDTRGAISDARVIRGVSPALDRAALEAFRTWQFEPATEKGQPVEFKYSVGIQFTLDRPRADEPLPYGGDFTPPARQASPMPSYPQAAWVAGVRGDVKLQLVIDEKGRVTDIQVLEGLPHGLTEAAVAAVKGWRFKAAQKAGKPVAVYHQVSLRFTP
jgi:TonB family protein